MKIVPLTTVEEQLMKLLWQLDQFYFKDVITQHSEPKPHPNTISTYLKFLVEKNYLRLEKEGRINKYFIALPRLQYKEYKVNELYESFFENNPQEFVDIIIKISPTENIKQNLPKENKAKKKIKVHSEKKEKKSKKKKSKSDT